MNRGLLLNFATIILISFTAGYSQQVSGIFSRSFGQEIRLEGFEGTKTYFIASDTLDASGYFNIPYTKNVVGAGYLITSSNRPMLVLLTGEDLFIEGEAIELTETIFIKKGQDNIWFEKFARQQPAKEQALNTWYYLKRLYTNDTLFTKESETLDYINQEIHRIRFSRDELIKNLPLDSYVRWYIPLQKLIRSVSMVAQFRQDEIFSTREALQNISYNDDRLYKSGLFRESLENTVWFIENSSGSLDSVYAHLNKWTDIVLGQLRTDEKKYREAGAFLFNLFEQRSLFLASEHIALALLNETTCQPDVKLANQLEAYRKLKIGRTAPDITFGEFTYFPEHINTRTLKDIEADFKILVFGAGWCPNCHPVAAQLKNLYPAWKAKGAEIILVSLDENGVNFAQFAANLPFLSTCDFKKWDGNAVNDYGVSGTPAFYLLDKNLKIILRPASVDQINAWLAWNQPNK